jgi:hypothetical protein
VREAKDALKVARGEHPPAGDSARHANLGQMLRELGRLTESATEYQWAIEAAANEIVAPVETVPGLPAQHATAARARSDSALERAHCEVVQALSRVPMVDDYSVTIPAYCQLQTVVETSIGAARSET